MESLTTPSRRSGTYVRQPTGYRAFIPASLPPEPAVAIDGALRVKLSQADRALGRLDGSISTLPNPDLFVLMYVRKEAVLSSQIEGTQSSLTDLLEAEARLLDPSSNATDVNEVINYVAAMNHGLRRLETLPVSVRMIREIHEILLSGTRGGRLGPGELRTSQNWIGPPGSTLADAVFVPPPPSEVPAALGDLEKFLHSEDDLPLLVKIGLAHAQLETIHPFLDGNGRVGRLLVTFLLCSSDVLDKPVLYLSHFFKRHRAEYYDRLQAVRDAGDWEGWIEFFLIGVEEVSREATETARGIIALRESHRGLIADELGRAAGGGHRLLETLFDRPIISVADAQEVTGTGFASANSLIARLTDLGIVEEITGNARNRRFRYGPYVRLFTD